MERLIGWLPKRPQPLYRRFGLTTALMAACVAIQLGETYATTLPGLFILFLGIFVSALAFDRASGFYATLLGAGSAYGAFSHLYPQAPNLVSVAVFTAVGFVVAALSEALRNAFERALEAERAAQLLLKELQHRTQNMLATTVSLLELQARSSREDNVRDALTAAAGRMRLQADVQRHLDTVGGDPVDLVAFLQRICGYHGETVRGVRPIAVDCRVEPLMLSPAKALALGLIANELITNALKYAFEADRPGRIDVSVAREPADRLKLTVQDDGVGCPDGAPDGLGTRLVQLLAREHGGAMERAAQAGSGCSVIVTMQA